ncbi:MAG TPA: hypothetical protein VMV05_06550 [bacterium]|nr:hypothetical protein [bacterium]
MPLSPSPSTGEGGVRVIPKIFFLILFGYVFLIIPPVFAEEPATPTPDATGLIEIDLTHATPVANSGAEKGSNDISKPQSEPQEIELPGKKAEPSERQKPSQGEGEKAPVQSRATAVPEFSLPEVVITGENELTIGAKRLDRKENDVTMGSRDLTGLDRSLNDLPGLSKTFTALTAEEAGPSKDTAFVLHAGGGNPGAYGGWGLFGQEFKDFQYLLNGFYSQWGGESTLAGFDGDKKYAYGLDVKLFPSAPFNLGLTGEYARTDAELPYQNSIHELHQGLDLGGTAQWKMSNLVQVQAKISNHSTTLSYWDTTARTNQTQELEGQFKVTAEDIDPTFNRLSLELGGRHATSEFAAPSNPAYDWGWLTLRTDLQSGPNLGLTAQIQGQTGNGLGLPLKFYPYFDFMWRFFGQSQLNLYWRSDRYVEDFHQAFMDAEHTSPTGGFPLPTEITREWGGRFTQKITEKVTASLSGSTAQILNYHQWADINPSTPTYIQVYSTVPDVQINKAGGSLQWNFAANWQASATYQWTQGLNPGGNNLNLTALPQHRGVLSLYRGDETWEARLSLEGYSERQAFDRVSLELPAYLTLGLDATYHLSKTFSLWLAGDNLLGQSYTLQPGYLEPRFHARGGIEIIF